MNVDLPTEGVLSLCAGAGGLDRGVRMAVHPEYAPAVEPDLCRDADALPAGMDLSRAARLRLTGNAVVDVQACYAFTHLRAAIEAQQ